MSSGEQADRITLSHSSNRYGVLMFVDRKLTSRQNTQNRWLNRASRPMQPLIPSTQGCWGMYTLTKFRA